MAGTSAFDVHYRLRPVARRARGGLLSSRRGIDLERRSRTRPGRARRRRLGARPARPAAADRQAPRRGHRRGRSSSASSRPWSGSDGAAGAGRARRPPRRRGRAGGRRQARAARARAARHPRRRPRAARGRARAREDADRALVRRGERARVQPRPVHARTCCPPTSPARRSGTSATATSSSAPGPIFTNLLLADEINRAPPKTQAALLEAMQERQVTTDGVTRPLERPFLVLATQNPIEYEGTYPLPEAQLDRFLLRTAFGYPDARRRVGDARTPDRAPRGRDRRSTQVIDRADAARDAGGGRARPRRALRRPLHRRARRGDPRELERRGRGEPARQPRAAQARPLPRRARRAATSSPRTTSRRSPCRRSPTGSSSSPSSGCSGARARTSSARRSRPCRRPPAEDVAPRATVTPFAVAPARVVRRPRGARPRSRALALRRAELVVVAAPFALVVAAGLLLEGRPEVRAWLSVDRDRALEGDEVDGRDRAHARTPAIDLLELHLAGPARARRRRGRRPRRRCGSRRRGADADADASLRALGLGRARRHPAARARAHRDARLGGPGPAPASAAGLSAARSSCSSLVAPLETQLATGELVARVRADGPRVRRYARRSSPATGCGRSTGAPAPAAAS